MKKSNFQQMLSGAGIEQVKKTAQSLSDGKDIERLSWLQEVASLRGNDMISNSLQAQVDGIKTASLNDEQLNLKIVSERIQKGVKLFTYSIERSSVAILWTQEKTPRFNGIVRVPFTSFNKWGFCAYAEAPFSY